MTYSLEFKSSALKEWRKLDNTVREQFKSRLVERLAAPRVESAGLAGMSDCYKIKLRSVAYRLVYQVIDDRFVIMVIAVGKREHDQVYRFARQRL